MVRTEVGQFSVKFQQVEFDAVDNTSVSFEKRIDHVRRRKAWCQEKFPRTATTFTKTTARKG
jgi:hypothetical protein